jgi:hypothetical protein
MAGRNSPPVVNFKEESDEFVDPWGIQTYLGVTYRIRCSSEDLPCREVVGTCLEVNSKTYREAYGLASDAYDVALKMREEIRFDIRAYAAKETRKKLSPDQVGLEQFTPHTEGQVAH